MHPCPDCGLVHEAEEVEIAETVAEEGATETLSDAAVEIAKIEARRDVKVEEIRAEAARDALAEIDAVRAEVAELRAMQATPEPVIVEVPVEVEPEVDDLIDDIDVLDAPEPDTTPATPKKKTAKDVWW